MDPANDAQLRVLQLLHEQPELSQRQLAQRLGVSVGKANYLIRALLEKGAIKATNFRTSKSKIAYVYLLTPAGFAHKAAHAKGYLQRKLAEYEALRAEIKRLRQALGTREP